MRAHMLSCKKWVADFGGAAVLREGDGLWTCQGGADASVPPFSYLVMMPGRMCHGTVFSAEGPVLGSFVMTCALSPFEPASGFSAVGSTRREREAWRSAIFLCS